MMDLKVVLFKHAPSRRGLVAPSTVRVRNALSHQPKQKRDGLSGTGPALDGGCLRMVSWGNDLEHSSLPRNPNYSVPSPAPAHYGASVLYWRVWYPDQGSQLTRVKTLCVGTMRPRGHTGFEIGNQDLEGTPRCMSTSPG